jgi:hypothetical protein
MSRKHTATIVILGIMMMLVAGCQGYKAPTYKSPTGAAVEDGGEEDVSREEVEIDVSDLETEEAAEETAGDDSEWEETSEVVVEEEAEEETSAVRSYSPAVKAAATATKTTTEKEADEFQQAAYRSVADDNLPTLTVTEGELVKLTVKATDADGDALTYDFGSPLNSDGKWQTRKGDVGVYYPIIKVSDGKEIVTKKIKVVVETKNNKPVLQFIPNVEVKEGDIVTLNVRATDADGDRLTYTYSGWMDTNTKQTDYSDSGKHKVTVSVTDGKSTVSQDVTVTVEDVNRAPSVEIEF